MVKITAVEVGSYAAKCGVCAQDVLISINGNAINDVLDYRFYLTESVVKLDLQRGDSSYSVKIRKDEYDDIGLDFETPLMDKKHTCKNGCIFCFIDQNPKGMRESIYFKDDDSRLSFLHGNYVTLTNMNDADVERIIKMRISPINISIHTTNPELRVKMMKNKRAGEVLRYLDDFKRAGLSMCGQIVLCRGVNDGDELIRSLNDLSAYYPNMGSVSLVPAGLTAHRDGLYPLSDYTKEEAAAIIDAVDSVAERMYSKHGSRMFYAADEFYLKAERPMPKSEYYEEYPQIENGVGMIRSFTDESDMALEDMKDGYLTASGKRMVSIVTGVASYDMIKNISERIEKCADGVTVRVHKIINKFFGETITVSGLLTGKDIVEQLSDANLGDELFVPVNSLRHGENVFLCGMTTDELSRRLGVPVKVMENDGYSFVESILGCE